jgi:hypothetical protein
MAEIFFGGSVHCLQPVTLFLYDEQVSGFRQLK